MSYETFIWFHALISEWHWLCTPATSWKACSSPQHRSEEDSKVTELPCCCVWLCCSYIWNAGVYTAFSYLEMGGPRAGPRVCVDVLLRICLPHLCSLMLLVFICLLTCIPSHSFAISLVSSHVFSCLRISPHLCGSSKHHGVKKWMRWVGMIWKKCKLGLNLCFLACLTNHCTPSHYCIWNH